MNNLLSLEYWSSEYIGLESPLESYEKQLPLKVLHSFSDIMGSIL